ncbi:MAG: RNA polymerase subunit sigma-70, partial [Lachnospiraceae bacterium]|nr:RNA polymerase subunit sigma-70 [Lachnospiraceae bacterium]
MEKEKFVEKLQKLVEVGKSKKSSMDINEVQEFFANEEMSKEQLDHVVTYLENHGIEVLRVMSDDLTLEENLVLDVDVDEDNFDMSEEEEIDLNAINLLSGVSTEDPVKMYLKEIGTVPLLTAD